MPGTPGAQAARGLRRAPGFLLAISRQDLLIAFDSPCGQGLFFFLVVGWVLLSFDRCKRTAVCSQWHCHGKKVTCGVCQVSSQKESI